ncbi:Type I restriction-modification system, specificity subunit S [Streptococcus parasanguinis]|uniref:restriction endonuclease subunit S n=1 Tax=Streptococcus parasanguinis TaxID=1318 RepID=UPI000AEA6797|nr:restriction endonuclease subunit S [Streptococcus parasanguinis]KXT88576.1 Type I restriction-modification system, specificity subunit S [Streptococcus parasanguinis]
MKLKKGRYRYNGFCKNWKLVKLGNIVEINPKSFLPRTFKYVDLESVVGTELISYREEFRESAPSRAQRVAQKGDVFYQTVRPYQKNNYLFDLNENDYVFSTGYAQLRPKVDSAFLLARLQEEGFVNKVIERCSGTSYPAINSKDLSRISITIPEDFDEQSSIGSLFRTLDDLLASYKDNLANYQSLKASMLSKMFPKVGQTVPEIRLDGFEGEWENKILSEVTNITMGQSPKSENYTDNPNDYILVQGNADIKDKQVVPRLWTTEVTKMAEIGDIILTVRAPVGDIGKTDFNVVIGRGVAAIKGNDFIFYTLEKMKMTGFWNRFSTGSTFESISSNDIKEAIIQLPTLEEQQAIGAYFSNLDNLIAAHQDKISQLEILKKKLLQDMFI